MTSHEGRITLNSHEGRITLNSAFPGMTKMCFVCKSNGRWKRSNLLWFNFKVVWPSKLSILFSQMKSTYTCIYVQWNFSKPDPQKTGSPWIPADFLGPLERKSHKTGHPSKLAIFVGPSTGRIREVSLYYIWQADNILVDVKEACINMGVL
jgi:hypothetical protein